MGQDPDTIRHEIEQTRERMGDTVEAIGYKADVPARTKDKVSGTFTGMKERIAGTASTVGDKAPGSADVKHAARRGASIAQENPLGLAIGSTAVGFLAGMLVPRTRVEDEKLGPMADQVKEQARQTGQEALEHGRQVAQEVAGTAQEGAQQVKEDVRRTAEQSAREHGEQVRQSAQESAQQVREQPPSP